MDSPAARGRVSSPTAGIKPVVACHLKVPFGDMLDEEFDEVNGRDGLLNEHIVLMPVVVESHIFPVIGVNAGKGNDRPSQVAADIFDNGVGIRQGRFGINIKPVLVFAVDKGLGLFKGGPDPFFHFIKEDSLECLAQVSVIEMLYGAPEAFVREAALCNEAVDMGVPFQGPSEGMEDADEARDKVLGHVDLIKHMGHNTANSLKKTVKKVAVFQKEMPEFLINGKDAVSVPAAEELEGHGGGAFLTVLDTAGGAEAAFTAERDEFHFATVGAGIHGSAEGRVTTVYHLFDVFHFNGPGMQCILDNFKIVLKNLL